MEHTWHRRKPVCRRAQVRELQNSRRVPGNKPHPPREVGAFGSYLPFLFAAGHSRIPPEQIRSRVLSQLGQDQLGNLLQSFKHTLARDGDRLYHRLALNAEVLLKLVHRENIR
jgi:hypothetical protein